MQRPLAAILVALSLSTSCALIYDYDGYQGRHAGTGSTGTGPAPSCECPPPPDTPCAHYSCDAMPGTCVGSYAPLGTPVTSGTAATPCHANACDGAGNVVTIVDATNVVNDGNECTRDACVADAPVSTPVNDGTPCGTAGAGLTCQSGKCTGCTKDPDCTSSSECLLPKCANPGPSGSCDTTPAPDGTQCMGTQFCLAGACHQCDVAAHCPAVPCQTAACIQGSCQYTLLAPFSSCSDGGPGFCFSGACRHCQSQNDCLSYQGGCCNAGVCSGSPTCFDGCMDASEMAPDCGGGCGKCNNDACSVGSECHTKFCNGATNSCTPCTQGISQPCDAPAVCNVSTGMCQ